MPVPDPRRRMSLAAESRRIISRTARLPAWVHRARQLVPPVLACFLSYICIVVNPLNRLTGHYAFLVNTSVILFYFPKGRVSTILENNTISLIGALGGLGWSSAVLAVAAWYGTHYGSDSSQSRSALGVGLAFLSLINGCLRSYAPRLNVACRAAMFYPIFLLTSEQRITRMNQWMFLNQFFVTLFAYIAATLCGVVLAEHSSAPLLGTQIVACVRTTCDLIPTSLAAILEPDAEDTDSSVPTPREGPQAATTLRVGEKELEEQNPTTSRQQLLAQDLRTEVAAMRATFKAYSLDIVRARHPPRALRPVIKVFGRLQRNALFMPTGYVPGERIRNALERAYATPHSPAVSRASSRPGTPRPMPSATNENGSGTPITPIAANFDTATPTTSALNSAASLKSFRLHSPALPRETAAEHLARELSKIATHRHTGSRIPSGNHDNSARRKLTATCGNLSNAIIAALRGSATLLTEACEWRWRTPVVLPHTDLLLAQLSGALDELEKRLSGILDSAEVPKSPTSGVVFEDEMTSDWLDEEDRFRIAFFMIALLDLARDTRFLLRTAGRLHDEQAPKQWYLPAVNWPWAPLPDDAVLPSIDREVPTGTDDHNFRYKNNEDLDFVQSLLHESRETSKARPRMAEARTFGERANAAWRAIWDRSGVVLTRVLLSKAFHTLKHSRHVHFALKQTIGISVLSLAAFLPAGNSGRQWYDSTNGAWMVVSFMYVLEVTTGATLHVGFYRMWGTFIGAVLGYIFTTIAHTNPYGLVVLCTAASVPISYGILFTEVAPMAIVTGITLPPIVFLQYLGLTQGKSQFHIAWERFVDIAIGIAAAVIIGMWLWPMHARVQYFSAVADTMDQITEYYLRMSRDLLRPSLVYKANNKQYPILESAVRRHLTRSRMLVDIQTREISLLPRPIKLYSEVIDLAERLIETFTEVRTLRFSLPRQETVLDVLPIRRELVSAILINLWACGQAFRSRSPLPQLLPSPRVPLGEVMDATDSHAQDVRGIRARANLRRRRGRDGNDDVEETGRDEIAVLYGMAENEALGEVITSLESLLAAARTLFGTQSFLDMADLRQM
ncbi:hypothetical protein CcaverHIS002_0509810 [Cutaneotrichosporon cavernicola]|uniref:Integral membrane bound transporter domain-containing protein n=1 Tax=Cutaneotrichosporon cavernicola TaxID=279322 RepID=A0AA48L7H1_9TREE|nr:uncharacterized protein CcaverHIS019_0510370 [Cutaneotrichosporon cavernicola]BEI85580.1 hypothetical protein CcaverHIS002_0509810 [Cutaneotrichosporon cavernicola]BEI93409.1 hypothetical protein CcaverHIS019_0510370 [Cutaneotrichosporon cavernicola]BEJ01187.1 hypothetical protein CcaverHIS631_0510440 [Cutaneotrichosporon cavernicola]BEJ08955.1 hypothetical protein CcaverHIS641_0510490 [Cutaneotrichosporon cavernicola]